MVWQRWRSLIAWLEPVLAEVRSRISESSTLCVSCHLPRASQPQHTSELLAQCGSSRGCWQEGLQMACKEEGSLLCTASRGFWVWTRQGIKTFYIHPAPCRDVSTAPIDSHTDSFHYKQQPPFPVLCAGKGGTQILQQVSIRAWDKVMGAALAPCSWLCSPSGAPTPTSLRPCPQPSCSTVVAQRKLMCQPAPALFPAGLQEKDALVFAFLFLWICNSLRPR